MGAWFGPGMTLAPCPLRHEIWTHVRSIRSRAQSQQWRLRNLRIDWISLFLFSRAKSDLVNSKKYQQIQSIWEVLYFYQIWANAVAYLHFIARSAALFMFKRQTEIEHLLMTISLNLSLSLYEPSSHFYLITLIYSGSNHESD